jgi:uncharacterized protein (DUF305 family)
MTRIFILTLLLLLLAGCSQNSDLKIGLEKHQMPDGSMMHGGQHDMAVITSQEQFLNEMIPHHQEAIDTSNLLLKTTTNPDLKNFLTVVVEVQTKEITEMKKWMKDWYGKDYQVKKAYMPMMGDLTSLSGVIQEMAYVNGMIVHHQGAITMAEQVLKLSDLKPEIAAIAKAIIEVQTKEITVLEGLLQGLQA